MKNLSGQDIDSITLDQQQFKEELWTTVAQVLKILTKADYECEVECEDLGDSYGSFDCVTIHFVNKNAEEWGSGPMGCWIDSENVDAVENFIKEETGKLSKDINDEKGSP